MSETLTSTAPRQTWIDIARGVGMILVVFGHIMDGVVSAQLVTDRSALERIDYIIYTFHMPLFFFLAGLNVEHSLKRGTEHFMRSKAWALLYPYLIWCTFQSSVIWLMGNRVNVPLSTSDLLAIPYTPLAQFWFLYALMLCHLAAALIRKVWLLFALSLVGLCLFLLWPQHHILYQTLHHLPLYVLGMSLSKWVKDWHPGIGEVALWSLILVVCFTFAATTTYSAQPPAMQSWQSWRTLPACLTGCAMIVALSKLMQAGRFSWLAAVGRMSMSIFVFHILIGGALRMLAMKAGFGAAPYALLVFLTLASVMLSMVLEVIITRMGLLVLLGLTPPSVGETPWKKREVSPIKQTSLSVGA